MNNKKYRVEFNTTGFYAGQGVWETLDEICEIEAETAQEAIELAITWFAENDTPEEEAREYAWKAAEIKYDEYGFFNGEWEYID